MSLYTSFPSLWSLFGGSIFRDEYRGNFAEARQQIEALQTQLQENSDELASIQLAKAIHGLLSGHINDAEHILDHMSSQNSMFNPKWQLRAEIYRRIILEKGSLLRAFDGCLDFPDFQTRLRSGLKTVNPTRKHELEDAWTEELRSEDMWLNLDIWAVKLRSMASQIPSTSPFHPKYGSEQQQRMVASLGLMLANLRQPGCPAGYGLRLKAELSRIQGSSNYLDILVEAAEAYRSQGQQAGEASCIMMEGDFHCSQQYSNITALNMVIYESTSHNGSDTRWDAIEDSLQLGDIDKAQRLYGAAQSLFAACDTPRGIAATHLRMACLTMFRIILSGNGEDLSSNDQYLAVRNSLQNSQLNFQLAGDYLSVKLVESHHIILDILSSGVSRAAAAGEIGIWGKQCGSFQFVHDIGLLFLRLGNHQWRNKRAFDHSVLLLEAAQALFADLDARGSEIQAEAARAEILSESMDLVAARILFLSAEQKLDELMKTLQTQVPPKLWCPQCEIVKMSINTCMVLPFFYLGDLGTLERLLSAVQSSQGSEEITRQRISSEPQLILYLAKLQYRQKIQEDDMTGGLHCLEMGFKSLSALDAGLYGEGRQVARINILGEMMRYEDARAIVRETSLNEDADKKLESDIASFNTAAKNYFTNSFYKTQLRLAMNSLDFALAKTYVQKLEKMEDNQYSKKGPNGITVSPEALYILGPLYEGLGDLEGAIIRINAHINTIEAARQSISDTAIRATSFGHNEVFEAFNTAVRICVQLHERKGSKMPPEFACDPPLEGQTWAIQALIFAERGKARTMLESVRASLNVSPQNEHSVQRQISSNKRRKLMEQISRSANIISRLANQLEQTDGEDKELVKKQLSTEQSHLRSLEVEFAQIESPISKERSLQCLQDAKTYCQNVDILEIMKHLPLNTVVLEYTTAYNGIAVFAINSSKIIACHWIQIRNLDLQQQILDFMWLMRYENKDAPDRTNRYRNSVLFLSATLIDPVASVLANTENIIFIPSGPLFNFPIGILEVSSQPLMLSHTISQVPSLSVWYELRRNRQGSEKGSEGKASVAVFCNSNKVESEFNLKFLRAEALAIAQSSSGSPIVTDQVSSECFREAGRGSNILHYCSHGNFDRGAPLLSSLQFLPKGSTENVSVLDLENMIGPAKLVVLSACFSGFGKILGSNDGYGFPHALLSMGVRAFVGSLWKVNENASLIFMFTFYREMLSEKPNNKTVTIAQAFAIAQRQLRNMSRDSYHVCIDQIILELQKCDPRLSKRIVNMREQIFLLRLSKKRDDPARFCRSFVLGSFCSYW